MRALRRGDGPNKKLAPNNAFAFFETSCINPRYHSNCTLLCHSSGSIKPYAFTQHSRETPTHSKLDAWNFGASGSEGMGL